MDALTSLSCTEFAAQLAGKSSVPGGGAAAAYAGALGAALGSMVGAFTTGKPKYAAYEDDIRRLMGQAEAIRVRLIELAEEDAAAFEPLARAYGIPKDDPSRADAIEAAAKGACAAPAEMMRQVSGALYMLAEMGEKGSRLLLSDVGCAAALCRGALVAASLNVFVNTASIADRTFAGELEAECDALLAVGLPKADAIAADVTSAIRGGER